MHIVLFEPEIPENTGNIVRLCAVTGISLHLIEPLGFSIDEKRLKRAGLDYWLHVSVHVWKNFSCYMEAIGTHSRLVMTSARGATPMQNFSFHPHDALVFGPETRGLPEEILQQGHARVRIPMVPNQRCLNLSTSAGIVLYAALAQCGILDTWS